MNHNHHSNHGGGRETPRMLMYDTPIYTQVIPPKAWYALQKWYEGTPAIFRKVIKYRGRLQLELYPRALKVNVQ